MSTQDLAPSWNPGAQRRKFITVTLQRLSICPCGYAVLDDAIQIGAQYQIDINSRRKGFTYECGNCSRRQDNIEVVDGTQRLQRSRPVAPLPYALFEVADSTSTANSRAPQSDKP
jgi:hypothetical protein